MEEELAYEYYEPVKKSYKIYENKHEYIDFVKVQGEMPKNLISFSRDDIYANYDLSKDEFIDLQLGVKLDSHQVVRFLNEQYNYIEELVKENRKLAEELDKYKATV